MAALLARTGLLQPRSASFITRTVLLPIRSPHLSFSRRAVTAAKQYSTAALMAQFSEGEDKQEIQAQLDSLLASGWQLSNVTGELQKTYYFKTYTKVCDFHHVIATRSKSENHHSTMITKARSLAVHWITHVPPGLSHKDMIMAKYCDEQADHIGTTKPSETGPCGSA